MTDAVLAAAHEAIQKGSKSFALASRLFDGGTRDRATLLYAWCRHCDDVIDGQYLGEGAHDWAVWGATPAQASVVTATPVTLATGPPRHDTARTA